MALFEATATALRASARRIVGTNAQHVMDTRLAEAGGWPLAMFLEPFIGYLCFTIVLGTASLRSRSATTREQLAVCHLATSCLERFEVFSKILAWASVGCVLVQMPLNMLRYVAADYLAAYWQARSLPMTSFYLRIVPVLAVVLVASCRFVMLRRTRLEYGRCLSCGYILPDCGRRCSECGFHW